MWIKILDAFRQYLRLCSSVEGEELTQMCSELICGNLLRRNFPLLYLLLSLVRDLYYLRLEVGDNLNGGGIPCRQKKFISIVTILVLNIV